MFWLLIDFCFCLWAWVTLGFIMLAVKSELLWFALFAELLNWF